MMNREVISLEYIKVSEAAQKWGLSPRRVRVLCAENRIGGVIQKGKLYMLRELAKRENIGREYVSLDDLNVRELAKTDPKMFLQLHKPPVLIDEVQYAPELFTYIKIHANF